MDHYNNNNVIFNSTMDLDDDFLDSFFDNPLDTEEPWFNDLLNSLSDDNQSLIDNENDHKSSKLLFDDSSDGDNDTQEVQGWWNATPELWTKIDTMDWLFWASNDLGRLYRDISPNLAIPGKDLLRLSRYDFAKYDRRFGGNLFDILHEIRNTWSRTNWSYNMSVSNPNDETSMKSDNNSDGETLNSTNIRSDEPSQPVNRRSRASGPKIWEFIRNLLLDPSHCPKLIRWENYERRIFRFMKPVEVAKLWGDRNGNANMNWGKFTRAMRYYYQKKDEESHEPMLIPIPRRLSYKFGPNATGLETDDPNFERGNTGMRQY